MPLRNVFRRRSPALSPELVAEVESETRWMYEWKLRPGLVVPVLGEELTSVHETCRDMIEGPIRERLAEAGPTANALDLGCNEGYFSHRLLDWGAQRVVGVDIREHNIRRALLLRGHFQIDPARLQLELADVFSLDEERLGTFAVVLTLGLIYHLEDPVGALRRARRLTAPGGLCVVESQLTRQTDPLTVGTGRTDLYEPAAASFAALYEHDQEANLLSSAGGIVSLIPNRAALELSMTAAGFERVRFLDALPDHNPQYVRGDRAVVVGYSPA